MSLLECICGTCDGREDFPDGDENIWEDVDDDDGLRGRFVATFGALVVGMNDCC